MFSIIDLRAISEGCDVEAVRIFGGTTMLECADVMNEVNKTIVEVMNDGKEA